MIDLAAMLAAHMRAMPTPDMPPAQFRPGRPQPPTRPTRFETRQVNGRWVLVPVAFAPGKADTRLTPKVSYTPMPK